MKRKFRRRQDSFAQVAASWAIEGQVMDEADRQVQREIAAGRLSHESAVRRWRVAYGVQSERKVG